MDNKQMGQFIAERRRQRGMTQRDLAERLNVTDKAVSKWERAQSSPDIALLQPLAALLDVTVDELLSGAATEPPTPLAPPPELRSSRWRRVAAVLFTLGLLVAEAVCVICDLAINHGITWSALPVSAIIFAWLVLTPVLLRGRYGVTQTLTALSLCIGPFLLAIACRTTWRVFTVGIGPAAVGVGYLWGLYLICCGAPERRLRAAALAFTLTVLAWALIRALIAARLRLPFLTAGEIVCLVQLSASAAALFGLDYIRHRDR